MRTLAAVSADELSDADLVDELVTLRKLADIAEAAYLTRLAAFHYRGISETQRALSTASWIRHRLHVAPSETTRSLKIAGGLAQLPVVAAALIDGDIRVPHAQAIVDGATMLGTTVVAEAQGPLVAAARTDDPSRLRAALRGYGAAVDNPRAVREAERRNHGRWLELASTFDGAVHLQGVLGAEDGAIIKAAVAALSTPNGGDTRTTTQRRADALVEVCRRQLSSADLPSRGGEAAHLTVITDLATIEARTGGFGELADGTILRGETVRRLACHAKITRLIVDAHSQPLDVGRTQRTATPAQRKALHARDRGCRFPGCDRPPEWADVHHIRFWSHGGQTNTDDMLLLCRKHHTAVHEGGWHISVATPGPLIFISPTGDRLPGPACETTSTLVTQLLSLTHEPARAGPVAGINHSDGGHRPGVGNRIRNTGLAAAPGFRNDLHQGQVA